MREENMKIGRILIVFIFIVLAVFVGIRVNQKIQAKKKAMNQPAAVKVVPVETTQPSRQEIIETIHASANIQADSEVTIYSKVNGKIAQNLVKMGSSIQSGQVVAIVNRDEVGYEFKPYEVKSDAKGVVSRLMQNPGAAVNPNVPLMTLVDIDTVKAVAAVDEKKIRFIMMNQPARVTLEAYPGEVFAARVTNISPVANAVNRTIDVELSIPNANHRIKPGMYAEVEWTESRRSSLVVPLTSVVEVAGQKYVFIADNGLARINAVTVGAVVGDSIEILSGLKGDEQVVTTGASQLNDKDKIKTIRPEATR
jgi:multidrug efflux pump subunit AcrA (membrane-fusion protein)